MGMVNRMKRRKRKSAKRYIISMIGLLSGLIIVILIMESVTGWRIKDLTKGLTAKTPEKQRSEVGEYSDFPFIFP